MQSRHNKKWQSDREGIGENLEVERQIVEDEEEVEKEEDEKDEGDVHCNARLFYFW